MDLAEAESPLPARADFGPLEGVDLHAQSRLDRTGGDLFDTLRIGTRVAFLLSDIAGKRPELDPIAAEMQRVFRATSTELFSAVDANLMEAAETLILALNHALIAVARGVRFAPTMVGCYDVQLGILAYINAGGQTAFLHDSEGIRPLPDVSMPLGLFTHLTYEASIQALEPGATLVVVTKGVTESMGADSLFGAEKVLEVLQRKEPESAAQVCSAVLQAAHQFQKRLLDWLPFRRKPVHEDMTALAMVRTA